MNDAEREAEKIFEEAYPEARAEACPQGENCGVHFRVDEEFIEAESEYACLITYVGEFAVVTGDNPGLPMALASQMLSVLSGSQLQVDLSPWETAIFHVGDGVLADADTTEKALQALRYSHTHNEWGAVKATHDETVVMLKAGILDVSKPLEI